MKSFKGKNVGCIGARTTPERILSHMEKIGEAIALEQGCVISGNAPGADQAFVKGANQIDPKQVKLFLPWRSFEKHALVSGNQFLVSGDSADAQVIAKLYLPRWDKYRLSVKKLMARNCHVADYSDVIIAYFDPAKHSGGTQHTVRIAKELQKPVINLFGYEFENYSSDDVILNIKEQLVNL